MQQQETFQPSFTPTKYPELNTVLEVLVNNLQGILGENLIGIYLQGSFAVGDSDENSDVDFIVITEREMTSRELDELGEMHKKIFNLESPWAQHLEGSYFPRDTIRYTENAEEKVWYLGHGSTHLERSDHCNKIHVRWVLHEKGVILAGPSPQTLVDKVDIGELKKEIYDTIHDWGKEILEAPINYRNCFYQTFIVLNYCRMLHDLKNGTNDSKLAGANWAKDNLDPKWSDLIDRTWAGRVDPAKTVMQRADEEDFSRTLEFIEYIMEESKKYYPE